MPTIFSSELQHGNTDATLVDSDAVCGGYRTKVATVDALGDVPYHLLKAYATFVYVDTNDPATEGWYYFTGATSSVDSQGHFEENLDADWEKLTFDSDFVIKIDGGSSTDTGTVDFISGDGMALSFTNGSPEDDVTFSFANAGNLTTDAVMSWDSDPNGDGSAVGHLKNSGLTFSGNNFSFPSAAGSTVTMDTLNVQTINAANTYSPANISTSDTFVQLADPTADPAAGSADESEYHRAKNAGLVINTGYYDSDFDNTGDAFDLSTHKLIYWHKTLLRWVTQDGAPELNTTPNPDTIINADQDYDGSSHVGRLAGTMRMVENFFLPDAQALHFGLPAIFALNHLDGGYDNNNDWVGTDPSVSSTTDKYMKTKYSVDPGVLFEWASFDQAAEDITTGANAHQTDYSWDDTLTDNDDDASNQKANTYVRVARVIAARVDLGGADIDTDEDAGTATIKVYHGGLFEDEIPIVRVFRKTNHDGVIDATAQYEEIMVKTRITDSQDYVEIIFSTGYLQYTAPSDTTVANQLFVRMVC